jgi:hypothetical protein
MTNHKIQMENTLPFLIFVFWVFEIFLLVLVLCFLEFYK